MASIFNLNKVKVVEEFLPVTNRGFDRDFWSRDIQAEIRKMALSGRPQRIFRSWPRRYRILDRLSFGLDEIRLRGDEAHRSSLASKIAGIDVAAPIYLADMSFGSLAGVPNIVEAEAADELMLISGTGEGGLHPEVARHRRIFVQWASARFGVDINTLMAGMGIVIKIGQGAKPGIGGHLPGSKVTKPISMVRRIPVGVDALSPAPHHDIYSIEDLKQRIDALKEATGKPVLVKIAATNYTPYIAVGIARMGADGIIIDGHGAGTGATPMAVRDNVGIPIELAVASADRMLREEGIRDRVTLIASGRVATADDAAKLIALGADAVALGTALLISMGCVMARTCHRGNCPAGITSRLTDGTIIVNHDLAKRGSLNFLRAFMAELGLILDSLGIDDVNRLVGRRDLLHGECIGGELAEILGVRDDGCSGLELKVNGPLWTPEYSIYVSQLVKNGEAVIVSMGSTAPPEVEPPKRFIDWVRFDGAQVTKPAIDPYREDIDVSTALMRGRLILSAPIILKPPRGWPPEVIEALKFVAHASALAIDLRGIKNIKMAHMKRAIWDGDGAAVKVIDPRDVDKAAEGVYIKVDVGQRPPDVVDLVKRNIDRVYGILIEGSDLGPYLVSIDEELRRRGIRYDVDVVVDDESVRSSGDVVKLAALGADAVEVGPIVEKALSIHVRNIEELLNSSLNLVAGLKKEIALLLGAAGIYTFHSIVGNRELLRALDHRVKAILKVKVAGEG